MYHSQIDTGPSKQTQSRPAFDTLGRVSGSDGGVPPESMKFIRGMDGQGQPLVVLVTGDLPKKLPLRHNLLRVLQLWCEPSVPHRR